MGTIDAVCSATLINDLKQRHETKPLNVWPAVLQCRNRPFRFVQWFNGIVVNRNNQNCLRQKLVACRAMPDSRREILLWIMQTADKSLEM